MTSPPSTTNISEMIHRFRTAEPKPRAIREAMKRNGDMPSKLWWEVRPCSELTNENKVTEQQQLCSLPPTKSNLAGNTEKHQWRTRFRFGTGSDIDKE